MHAIALLLMTPMVGTAAPRQVVEAPADRIQALRRAAVAGDAEAQWALGVALDTGDGVADDPQEAVMWFRRAMASGNAKAFVSMAVMHATGRGVPRDYKAAREHYWQGALHGNEHGFYGIAILYARGEGMDSDPVEAMAWMLVAAKRGDVDAQRLLAAGAFGGVDAEQAAKRAAAIDAAFASGQVRAP